MKKITVFNLALIIFNSFWRGAGGEAFAQNNNKQYFSHDIGVLIGAGYYIGDLNSKNFYMSQPAFG
ncbi:MAG TPA: hypothetical protein VF411_13820, partial [Bacteroidia bacterium]